MHRGDAADLPLEDGSVHAVVMDPPYYANVQYAELSDFLLCVVEAHRRSSLPPSSSLEALTEKETEAVANPARFKEFDRRNASPLWPEPITRRR